MQRWIRQFPLLSFFVLAFGITWGFQVPAIVLAQQQGLTLSNEMNLQHFLSLFSPTGQVDSLLPYLLFTLGAGPLVASLCVTWAIGGTPALRDLLKRTLAWKVAGRWYLVVLLLPLLMAGVSLLLGVLFAGVEPSAMKPRLSWTLFLPFLLYMVVFTGVVEEVGWRGFALPQLQRTMNAEKASWILGILWGVWHFPFILYYNREMAPGMVLGVLVSLVLSIVGWTIVNTWVYNNTRSVLLLVLLHGWGNTVQSYLVLSTENMLAQTAYSLVPWVVAVVLLRKFGAEHLSAAPRPVLNDQGMQVEGPVTVPRAVGLKT
ncbi:CPBP family intramembrane glutamic endopeptidase [Deinococcus cellulosilyticus]|uniref:CPBP family intramembrane metalloprotease n=1 Tax=Deinococcus cellulosilyticus (strain DSM 18568 / NBRC 106333 / KACC 11606 / 5516J-15) TaxID=1223518 RepID=A0A511MVT4_DEIC1|nr:CPBP family intramembrane glutamic endopeptidase [Deinococcus cellulosilyticus]GEM44682.1 CPBP family intramembrane metalloprotease [Deinococcus cellulosilyticus NBRC 106333 = KACC 11606]